LNPLLGLGLRLLAMGLTAHGVAENPELGLAGGLGSAAKVGGQCVAKEALGESRALTTFYPAKDGFLGATRQVTLKKGQVIDRFGGSEYSRFFSPSGTPAAARALPPEVAGQSLRAFQVLKPFEVQSGTVAPAFGQFGLGTQFRSPTQLGELLERGLLKEIKP
ncbi:MAG: TNT domain-containing protein, partial [Pseudomonadota bacterium]